MDGLPGVSVGHVERRSGQEPAPTATMTGTTPTQQLQSPGPLSRALAVTGVDVPEPQPFRQTINGIRMYWTESGTAKGDNTVVLLHGVPASGYTYRYVIPELVRRGFHVVVPDLRGFNRTEKPGSYKSDAGAYTLSTYAADIKALIERVTRKQADHRAVVVGTDWGGAVAHAVAAMHPESVRGLMVANGPHPAIWREDVLLQPTRKQFQNAWYALCFGRIPWLSDFILRRVFGPVDQIRKQMLTDTRTASHHGITETDVQTFAKPFLSDPHAARYMMQPYQGMFLHGQPFGDTNYPGIWAALRSYVVHLFKLNRVDPLPVPRATEAAKFEFPKTTVPTHILFGADDGYITSANATPARLEPWVKGPLTTKIVDGVSHWIMDEEPGLVADELQKFFATLQK